MDSITKICTRCKQEKPIEAFGKSKYECLKCGYERQKIFYTNHPEKRRQYDKKRDKNNNYLSQKSYKEKNLSKHRRRQKEYADNHRDEVNKNSKVWRMRHPDKVSAARHTVRAQRKGAEGTHTPEEWRELCERYGNKCLCCNEVKPLTVDHVIPLSKGGTNYIDNIQPLCKSCNCRKSTKTIDYRCKTTS